MKRVRLIAAAAVLAVAASTVAAQDSNSSERTFLTFSGAVEMPGVTLQPGTYVFKLADTASRNVVQVWDNDQKNMVGHWLFVPAQRSDVSSENVVMFKENREGTTPAVQYWYYPGERIGKEFVYPKDQATKIAARTGSTVLSNDGEVDASTARVRSIDGQGSETEWQRESSAASTPASASNTIQGSELPPAPATDAAADTTVRNAPASAQSDGAFTSRNAQSDNRPVGTSGVQPESQVARSDGLPQTAGALPLSGLIGLLSLAGAYGLRALRR